jgi:hypothetical protein
MLNTSPHVLKHFAILFLHFLELGWCNFDFDLHSASFGFQISCVLQLFFPNSRLQNEEKNKILKL